MDVWISLVRIKMGWCVRVMQTSILIPSYTLFKLTAATLPMYRSTIEDADIVPGPTPNQLPHSLLEQKSPHEWPSGQCTFTFEHSFNSWTAPEIKIWYHQPAVFPKTFVHLQVTTHFLLLSTFQSGSHCFTIFIIWSFRISKRPQLPWLWHQQWAAEAC